MRRSIIAGNWKMNCTLPDTEALTGSLLAGGFEKSNATVIVCPPFTSLETANRLLGGTHIALGAQDMSERKGGAFTGDICSEMLLTLGVSYVILGHSERRQYHAESDALVNAKTNRALEAGLVPIVCVGETLEHRDDGRTEDIVGRQIEKSLAGFSSDDLIKIVVAYEPVWAIGTGKTATPEMAQEVHRFIRERLALRDGRAAEAVRILYGGSVKADNATALMKQPDIDGALVGGASLKAEEFIGIINSV